MLLVLLGSLLGDLIAWSTQQDGAVVHDIAPIKTHEHDQLGSGSAEELTWHTEDAFHPCRGDYLGMMCLRNPDRVPTTFAALDVSALDGDARPAVRAPLHDPARRIASARRIGWIPSPASFSKPPMTASKR